MRKRAIASLVIAFFCFGTAQAQNLPDQKETLKTIVKVNDYFMKKYKDYRTPSYVKNVVRPSNISPQQHLDTRRVLRRTDGTLLHLSA